jgi:hypothetical protein
VGNEAGPPDSPVIPVQFLSKMRSVSFVGREVGPKVGPDEGSDDGISLDVKLEPEGGASGRAW